MENFYNYKTPIGMVTIYSDGNAITRVEFVDTANGVETPLICKAANQLNEYLCGQRKSFDIPLQATGTQFQQKVWQALQTIPYGETWSYRQLADAAGNIKACRAVGNANNKNPLPIFVPCHRVIGSNGKLVGYAAGLKIKQQLLELEQKCR